MRRYALTRAAQHDLQAIRAYLLLEANARVARRVLARLTAAFRLLSAMPGLGHRREELAADPIRFWQIPSYQIVYDPSGGVVTIVRVLHARRDIASILQR